MIEHPLADIARNAVARHHGADGAAEIMHADVAQSGLSRVREEEVARAASTYCLSKLGECQLHAVSVVVLGTAARDDEGWITGLKIEIADAARSDLRAPLAVSSASLRMRAMPADAIASPPFRADQSNRS